MFSGLVLIANRLGRQIDPTGARIERPAASGALSISRMSSLSVGTNFAPSPSRSAAPPRLIHYFLRLLVGPKLILGCGFHEADVSSQPTTLSPKASSRQDARNLHSGCCARGRVRAPATFPETAHGLRPLPRPAHDSRCLPLLPLTKSWVHDLFSRASQKAMLSWRNLIAPRRCAARA